jgi:cytochrome P450
MLLLTLLLLPPLYILLTRTLSLYRNYTTARLLGIPIILSPVSWQDPLWLPLQPLFKPLTRLPLPKAWTRWITFSTLGWALEHRYHPHAELGPLFAIVSPRKTEFALADPVAGEEVLAQWKTWTKSEELYKIFETFGRNVNSAGVSEWPRHRKIVSHGFKESNIKIVWETSMRQAELVGRAWETREEVSCGDLETDAGTFSLLVLAAALWGEEHDFGEETGLGSKKLPEGHGMTYKDALRYIMEQILLVIMFDALVLPEWLLIGPLKKLKKATGEYRMYLQEKVENEREHLREGGHERANLAAILVAANEKAKSEDLQAKGIEKGFLTDEELYGNFFMLNLAGHETTATTVAFSLALLGSHPEVQAWVREEVDATLDLSKGYHENFPRLARVMCVMYETLRLYGAVQNLDRYSRDGHAGQVLKIGEREYRIPASTYVAVNFQGIHTDPKYWGEDSLEWRPQRWITSATSTSSVEAHTNAFNEQLGGPPERARFVAWALGPRECPGKKFSKVEFVAAIACLLKKYEVRPAVRKGETEKGAEERLHEVVKDCVMSLAPRFKRPLDAGVVLEAR